MLYVTFIIFIVCLILSIEQINVFEYVLEKCTMININLSLNVIF